MKQVDYIVVGQGIAGTMLSYFLMKAGQHFIVVDNQPELNSSKVAAGIINPVTFRRMNQSFMAPTLIPFAKNAYAEMEALLGIKALSGQQILKIFPNEKQKDRWIKEWQEGRMDEFLSEDIWDDPYTELLKAPHGAAVVKNSGAVYLPLLLSAWKDYLKKQQAFVQDEFQFDDFSITGDGLAWKDYRAKKIIFCQGFRNFQNPYFKEVPVQATKGEVLIVEIKGFEPDHIINKNGFLLPVEKHVFKLGATYAWKTTDETPTAEGRAQLEQKLQMMFKVPYKILDQQAGIRPTTPDRKPVTGIHPEKPQLVLFNGMGTKGVMYAPYFAQQLVAHLTEGKPVPVDKVVGLQRFYK